MRSMLVQRSTGSVPLRLEGIGVRYIPGAAELVRCCRRQGIRDAPARQAAQGTTRRRVQLLDLGQAKRDKLLQQRRAELQSPHGADASARNATPEQVPYPKDAGG
jgi:hypothetical protein